MTGPLPLVVGEDPIRQSGDDGLLRYGTYYHRDAHVQPTQGNTTTTGKGYSWCGKERGCGRKETSPWTCRGCKGSYSRWAKHPGGSSGTGNSPRKFPRGGSHGNGKHFPTREKVDLLFPSKVFPCKCRFCRFHPNNYSANVGNPVIIHYRYCTNHWKYRFRK